ncbi:hypothetical protein BN7_6102 [Wickerhamomyces ciferrii]|uniref:Uncharacterized protein n=1 Tax=Wickerhamomyces ciferrii (strain ATCC 14091 / BCRC 22168 / CBS 111 / JCM 3599 / NBRC 0793 / NRRL Y-1031 F-60-10) TaxID=1206466 RepID=K0KYK4_WICCF|nr:uncharacterized protein BN7_6102 [Wickerhamomyces ciferrii]CCH46509.1 hypothetical protein BN7_6102 [Wickerhamomyces ciferrii]
MPSYINMECFDHIPKSEFQESENTFVSRLKKKKRIKEDSIVFHFIHNRKIIARFRFNQFIAKHYGIVKIAGAIEYKTIYKDYKGILSEEELTSKGITRAKGFKFILDHKGNVLIEYEQIFKYVSQFYKDGLSICKNHTKKIVNIEGKMITKVFHYLDYMMLIHKFNCSRYEQDPDISQENFQDDDSPKFKRATPIFGIQRANNEQQENIAPEDNFIDLTTPEALNIQRDGYPSPVSSNSSADSTILTIDISPIALHRTAKNRISKRSNMNNQLAELSDTHDPKLEA